MADQSHERPEIRVEAAAGGWPHRWPNVAEVADVLPSDQWTLVGGLMTQLHTVRRGLGVVRPTNDVDILLHIETTCGVPANAARALETLGYRLQERVDPRTAHRWVRGGQVVDVGGSQVDDEDDDQQEGNGQQQHRRPEEHHVDVLTADHPAPIVIERMRGRDMVPIEGGTQALRRTINAVLDIRPDRQTTVSVPRSFAAVILKAAAYVTDSRDRDRHLFDAAALLACIEDPFAETEHLAGSDRRRVRTLVDTLPDRHPAWRPLDSEARTNAQAALRIRGALSKAGTAESSDRRRRADWRDMGLPVRRPHVGRRAMRAADAHLRCLSTRRRTRPRRRRAGTAFPSAAETPRRPAAHPARVQRPLYPGSARAAMAARTPAQTPSRVRGSMWMAASSASAQPSAACRLRSRTRVASSAATGLVDQA
jgi:hypothetical protein